MFWLPRQHCIICVDVVNAPFLFPFSSAYPGHKARFHILSGRTSRTSRARWDMLSFQRGLGLQETPSQRGLRPSYHRDSLLWTGRSRSPSLSAATGLSRSPESHQRISLSCLPCLFLLWPAEALLHHPSVGVGGQKTCTWAVNMSTWEWNCFCDWNLSYKSASLSSQLESTWRAVTVWKFGF